jgi:hypothetical protein
MKYMLPLAAGAAIFASAGTVQAGGIDLVFGIDESGSMQPIIDKVKTVVHTIYDALPTGSHVGLVGYGTYEHCGEAPHIHTPLTSDPNVFLSSLNDMVGFGALEEGYRLVYEIATDTVSVGWNSSSNACTAGPSLGFTGTQHCQVIISNEKLDQGDPSSRPSQAETIKALQDNGGIFFGILKDDPNTGYHTTDDQPLADAVAGGEIFDLDAFMEDPTTVINSLLTACADAIGQKLVVTLASFSAIRYEGTVMLEWKTDMELDNAGFNIWRSETEAGEYTKINDSLLPAQGSEYQYSFTDDTAVKGKTYYYKLEDIDLNGTATFHGPVSTKRTHKGLLPAIQFLLRD